MSKEEFMKIQTCILKVNIHCDGCKHNVKKILQKIDGVYKTSIDSEQGRVTVSGNVDPAVLIKKLAKSGKHAELWGAPKANKNNQNHLANQFKNMQLDNGKGGNNNNNKGGQKGNNNNNNQPKEGQPTPQQLQQLQQFQLQQQLHQLKRLQDLKLPQLTDMKMPPNDNNNQKATKFAEEEDFSDDDYDDDLDDDYDLDDDEYDDELDDPHHPLNKMKPVIGNGPKGVPNMMLNGMMNGNHPHLMNDQKAGQNGAVNGGGNGKKGGNGGGGGNALPVQVLTGSSNDGKNGKGGKKGGGGCGGNNNGGNQNQGGGGKNVGKNGGGLPQEVKAGNSGGGGNKNGVANGSNGGKKGNNGAPNGINDGFPNMGALDGGNTGHQMGNVNMAMAQMGNLPMSQMGNITAVQGLPASTINGVGGGGVGGRYFQGAGPDVMAGNPYHQQQYLAAMMNHQRAMAGNESFQPMMYARPSPAINYMPPYPYPYPYPPLQPDPYTHFFSDENTSSCNVM
ncbi:heavy metal-associated isoprenylated plant protein 32-like [Durio zibethinus]|uniref:Heavy metal-associated isoprenylated plant protein 32-like n=1 Tax=Durio zibethinus TaxID=66656 RepID=A0A6P6A8D7_DURZI|nr:heavy metal-associated isoprenylated plant protein 32-like [Durio zibethinus]